MVNGSFGIIPYKKPIHTIIGKPLIIHKNENPNVYDLLNIHQQYVNHLQDLFNKYKHLYPQIQHDLQLVDHITIKDIQKWKKTYNHSKL